MSRIIATIDREPVTLHDDGRITFRAKAAVDTDGSGPLHGDPDAQTDTSLHLNGKPLNADVDRYIVVPPAILIAVKPIVLGCQAYAQNARTNRSTPCVVGDIGPHRKIGEVSVATAIALGINPSPVSGGEDEHVIDYTIIPGQAAVVGDIRYTLQAS